MRHTTKIGAAAFTLSTISTVAQTAMGRKLDRFGLLDMAMPTLTATVAAGTRPGRARDATTVALLASTAGDMSATLQFKVGWFAAAHVAYITAFAGGTRRPWWPTVPAIVAAGVWATTKAAGLRPACILYATLVGVMAATAGSYSRLAGVSAVAFAASDFLIAFGTWRAKRQPAWGEALMLAIYLLAQAGLSAAVIRKEGSQP